MKDTASFGWRYEIVSTIGHGTMGTVYHAIDRYINQNVALKAIYKHREITESGNDHTAPTTVPKDIELHVALTREFRALASLRHPNVISVKDYGFVDGNPYFSMELLQENQNLIEAGTDLPEAQKFDLVKQVLQALTYIHQRGIIHRDLKPDNIQVIDGQAKLLDFGLALRGDDQSEKMAGTLAYMPPEVLSGDTVNTQSDLYALGMMCYELFTGSYPFPTENLTDLIQSIVFKDLPIEETIANEQIATFITKMVHKDPDERFETARDALNYCLANGLVKQGEESPLIRESFLQAAQFVGRDDELSQLNQGVRELQKGKGSAWLIGGESGVGKTRLIDELRIQAMVDGVQVLHGQTVEAGGTPYVLMQNPLKQLCLSTDLLEEEIPTVLPYVTEIGDYLIERANELSGGDDESMAFKTGVRRNLVTTIENLIRRQTRPMLMILEDLHWVKESLSIVQHLVDVVADLPLMIVASYRDDERPELGEKLNAMQFVKLNRLSRDQIEELTESIIGDRVSQEPALIDVIERETEGNVFFIVEVIRVLAERAGQLNLILHRTLPTSVISGGIDSVVQRRLERLPEEMMGLLKLAALGGKQIDVKLLEACDTMGIDMNRWLLQCDSAAILEASGDNWYFAHDKIRTALIHALTAPDKRALHRQLADNLAGIEVDAKRPRYALIAYHYEESGEGVKAIEYYEKAAEQALRLYAIENTRQYLTHIKRLELHVGRTNQAHLISPEQISHRHRLWGEVADAYGDLESSRDHYERVLSYMQLGTDDDMTISKIPLRGKNSPLTQPELDLLFAVGRLLTIYLLHGDWARAQSVISRQSALYFVLGMDTEWIETMAIEAWIYYYQGNFKRSMQLFNRIFFLGKQKKLASLLHFGGSGIIMNALRLEVDNSELQEHVDSLHQELERIEDTSSTLVLDGVLSFAYWTLGDKETARKYVDSALSVIDGVNEFRLYEFAGIVGVIETLLRQGAEQMDDKLLAEIRLASRALHIFAQVYPLARPRAWIYQGRQDKLRNKYKRAVTDLQLAIKEAQKCNISYDEGVAYLTLARLVKGKDTKYPVYLDLAIARFAEVEAMPQLKKAQDLRDQA